MSSASSAILWLTARCRLSAEGFHIWKHFHERIIVSDGTRKTLLHHSSSELRKDFRTRWATAIFNTNFVILCWVHSGGARLACGQGNCKFVFQTLVTYVGNAKLPFCCTLCMLANSNHSLKNVWSWSSTVVTPLFRNCRSVVQVFREIQDNFGCFCFGTDLLIYKIFKGTYVIRFFIERIIRENLVYRYCGCPVSYVFCRNINAHIAPYSLSNTYLPHDTFLLVAPRDVAERIHDAPGALLLFASVSFVTNCVLHSTCVVKQIFYGADILRCHEIALKGHAGFALTSL